jgi:hypothetical protein
MTAVIIVSVIVTVASTLIVNGVSDYSPWVATRLVRWSARQAFPDDPERAKEREEELEANVGAIPGKLSKLVFGLGFGIAGVYELAHRSYRSGPWWARAGLTVFFDPFLLLINAFFLGVYVLVLATAAQFSMWLYSIYPLLGIVSGIVLEGLLVATPILEWLDERQKSAEVAVSDEHPASG